MMDSQTRLPDIFSQSVLFTGVEDDRLSDILNLGQRCVYKTGAILFREGDPAEKSYLVLKGRFKLSKLHEDGKEAIVRYVSPGKMMAAISAFKGKDYPVTAQAVSSAEVVGWDRKTMADIISRSKKFVVPPSGGFRGAETEPPSTPDIMAAGHTA